MIELKSKFDITFWANSLQNKFTGFSIQAVRERYNEVDESTDIAWCEDHEAEAFGVYATMEDGTSNWIADIDTRENAEQFIEILKYCVYNFVPKT